MSFPAGWQFASSTMRNSKRTLRFERQPAPVLPEHRPLYKIGQLLLVLHLASRGKKSSLPRIHLFNWALKRQERKALLLDAGKKGVLRVAAWGFDPAIAIAIEFALAECLITTNSTGYALTAEGINWVKNICKDPECFPSERQFLEQLGTTITETMVTQVAKGWEE